MGAGSASAASSPVFVGSGGGGARVEELSKTMGIMIAAASKHAPCMVRWRLTRMMAAAMAMKNHGVQKTKGHLESASASVPTTRKTTPAISDCSSKW